MLVDHSHCYPYSPSLPDFYYRPISDFNFQSEEETSDKEDDSVEIQGKTIRFTFDGCKPAISCDNKMMTSIQEVLREIPPPHPKHLEDVKTWASIITYLNDYDYIDNPEKFKHDYKIQAWKEHYLISLQAHYPSLSTQGIDIEEVSSPRLENQKLIFYVKRHGMPYRITVAFQVNTIQLLEELLLRQSKEMSKSK